MKSSTRKLALLLLFLLVTLQCSALTDRATNSDIESEGSDDDGVDNEKKSGPIELNPGYVEDSEEEVDEGSDAGLENDIKSTKSELARAMRKNRPYKAMQLIKKHRLKITVALALFAFRRELFNFILNQVAPVTSKDPDTGKITRNLRIRFGLTDVIKILVFIDVLRQLQVAGKKAPSSLLAAVVLLGTKNPFLGSFVSKILLSDNPTFVPAVEQHFTFERVNERYTKDCLALQKASSFQKKMNMSRDLSSSLDSILHPEDISEKNYSETVIVLDLNNLGATGPGVNRIDILRDEVAFLLHQHRSRTIIPYGAGSVGSSTDEMEVLIVLESPGGGAQDFAVAAQQVLRLRNEPGITVTICVDKVAASGGYMIACCASPGHLLAAPFAMLGSIGVVGQVVNIQKMLEGWGVRPFVFRGGKEKAPLSLLGSVNRDDLAQIQMMVDDVHRAFKQHVSEARPDLKPNIDKLATGRMWLGYDAVDVGLIDRITTSDAYIGERMRDGARILRLMKHYRRKFSWGSPHPSYSGTKSEGQSILGSSLMDPILTNMGNLWSILSGQSNVGLEQLASPLPSSRTFGSAGLKASAVEMTAAASASA